MGVITKTRRDNDTLMVDILSCLEEHGVRGTTKYNLFKTSNTQYRTLARAIKVMVDRGLAEPLGLTGTIYRITPVGVAHLKMIRDSQWR